VRFHACFPKYVGTRFAEWHCLAVEHYLSKLQSGMFEPLSFCAQLFEDPANMILKATEETLLALGLWSNDFLNESSKLPPFAPLHASIPQPRLQYPVDFSPDGLCGQGVDLPFWPKQVFEYARDDTALGNYRMSELGPRNILRALVQHGVSLSNWIVDIGASRNSTGVAADLGQLVDEGSAGFLVDGGLIDDLHVSELYTRYANRADVCLVLQMLRPEETPVLLRQCMEERSSMKRPLGEPVVTCQECIDWLKIDVENGDCTFLDRILSYGFKPLIVQIEVNGAYPPPLSFEQHFADTSFCKYNEGWVGSSCLLTQGCNLVAVLRVLERHCDYRLLQYDEGDAIFVRADVAEAFGTAVPSKEKSMGEALRIEMRHRFCDPLRPYRNGLFEVSLLRYDTRLWIDPSIPLETREGWFEAYLRRFTQGVNIN